jgi:hypothetical protein
VILAIVITVQHPVSGDEAGCGVRFVQRGRGGTERLVVPGSAAHIHLSARGVLTWKCCFLPQSLLLPDLELVGVIVIA